MPARVISKSIKQPKPVKQTKTQKPKANRSVKLFEELEFISVVFDKSGTPQQQHCCFNNGRLTASNNVISAGIRTDVDLNSRPHIMHLLEAIRNCPTEFAMTQVDPGKLFVKADKFSAAIPCLPEESPGFAPDAPCAAVSDAIKAGMDIAAPFSKEDAKKVILGSVLLRQNSLISTDAVVIMEVWHGMNLPTLLLPKSFISAVLDTDKSLKELGFSNNSVTFFYDDNSWVKTQLYEEAYPNIDNILNVACNPQPLPIGFYKALVAIEPFSKSGNVYFGENCLQSHRDKGEGAVFDVPGIHFGPCFNIKQLKRIESCIKVVDFYSNNYAMFFGEANSIKVRGALMGVRA